MKIFTKKEELSHYLDLLKQQNKVIGLVPTMGALHKGHLSLIGIASAQSDVVVCTIFVNPTQFNDPKDLEKYPRPIEQDLEKLKNSKCDALFMPEVSEMYHGKEEWHMHLGDLETVLEARSRPGHYQGVTQIVKKLLDAVKPDKVFFGQKDYQQFMVIRKMTDSLNLPVELVLCPIVREDDGLAMSSRNIHLSPEHHQQALALSKALVLTKKNFTEKTVEQLKAEAVDFLNASQGVKLDYFEICNADDLQLALSKQGKLIALVAAYVGGTRLIDNVILT